MKFNHSWKIFYFIFITILFIAVIFLTILYLNKISNKFDNSTSESKENDKQEKKELLLKRRYFSLGKRIKNFYSIIPNNIITSVYIRTYETDNTNTDFFYVNYKGKKYISDESKFLFPNDLVYYYPLVNVKFPFLNIKDNINAYLHPFLAMKMLYIFERVNFNPRLSEALRDLTTQLKYKRRGWSDVEKSPHMLGLAFDISRYTWEDKKIIKNLTEDLSLNYLEHGGRRNMHIHIQDDKIWTKKYIAKNVINISENLIKEYYQKESLFNKYIDLDSLQSEKFLTLENDFTLYNNNIYNFKNISSKNNLIKIEIYNILGDKIVEIFTIMNKNANGKFIVDFSFLAPGIYKMKFYEGNSLPKEDLLKIY